MIDAALGRLLDRLGARYLYAFALANVAGGAVACALAVVALRAYVTESASSFLDTLILAEATLLAAYTVGTAYGWRLGRPIERWLAQGRPAALAEDAWRAALRLPARMVRFLMPVALLFVAVPVLAFVATRLRLGGSDIALLTFGTLSAASYAVLLSFLALDAFLHPIVREAALGLGQHVQPPAGSSARRRLAIAVVVCNVASAAFVVAFAAVGRNHSGVAVGPTVLGALALTVLAAALLGRLMVGSIVTPITDLERAAARIADGDLARRPEIARADELGVLAAAFNTMVDGLTEGAAARARAVDLRRESARYAEEAALRESRMVADERAAIAAELNDIVAHAVTLMILQAGASETLLASDPARAAASLESIEVTGRDALVSMRRFLGVLRTVERPA